MTPLSLLWASFCDLVGQQRSLNFSHWNIAISSTCEKNWQMARQVLSLQELQSRSLQTMDDWEGLVHHYGSLVCFEFLSLVGFWWSLCHYQTRLDARETERSRATSWCYVWLTLMSCQQMVCVRRSSRKQGCLWPTSQHSGHSHALRRSLAPSTRKCHSMCVPSTRLKAFWRGQSLSLSNSHLNQASDSPV